MKRLINKMLFEPTSSLLIQLLRYCLVGGIAFIVDNGSYYLFISLNRHYGISAVIGFAAGLIVNYMLSKRIVFKNEKARTNAVFEFIIYGLIGAVGLVITELLLWIFIEKLLTDPMISKLVASIAVLVWNFTARKVILYQNN